MESSVQPIAYHGIWAKLPGGVLGRFSAASGMGVPHHGGSIALEAVPVAVSKTAARAAVSQKHLLNRRITRKSPPGSGAPPWSPGIGFAILKVEVRDRYAECMSLRRQAPEGVGETPLPYGR